jgi:hypothetical protein
MNARLQSGDLETWRGLLENATLANAPQTIYLLNDAWLSWEADVDVARGTIPGDTTFRTYLTGPDIYTEPRFTTYALATTGSQPYPVVTRPLGVPPPDSAAALVIGVDTTPTTYSIDVLDEGDSLETNWVTSATNNGVGGTFAIVSQDAVVGNPAPSYELTYNETHNAGQEPHAVRNFSIGNAAVVHASADIRFGGDTSQRTAGFIVACSPDGAGVMAWFQNGSLQLRNASEFSPYTAAVVDTVAVVLSAGVWYTLDVSIVVNNDGTQTVTVRVFQGSGELASVTGTAVFTLGDYCAITAASASDAGLFVTYFDNIHVQASGSNGFTPVDLATSYVYTFVNDLGEESAPSPVSATIRRPDGVSVTVTTPTAIPSGISADYGIATKRIYRAATGNTGTFFRFVAEIDLDEPDYVDVLTDAALGELLESDEFDLPPADLRGILALPNGIMVGFSKNQLCLSARNRPHAWPVSFRLTTDTDIVGIENVDNTVVIGTEAYPYLATGTDPATYSMTKLEVQQASVAKRSFGTLTGLGVLFASPDGLIAVQGPGQVRNVTEGIFTRRQWQDLVPQSIRAVVHDDIYFFWLGDGSSGSDGGYALDLKPSGFGLIRLSVYADAMYADPLTDKLYLAQGTGSITQMGLFHFTEDELDGVSTGTDETGATWTDNSGETLWDLPVAGPAPKFGTNSLGTDAPGATSWDRDASQVDPVPDSYLRPANESFALDFWSWSGSDVATGNSGMSVGGDVGGAALQPGPTTYVMSVTNSGGPQFLDGGPLITDQWVHVRGCYDGTTARLFINGVLQDSLVVDLSDETEFKYLNFGINGINDETIAIDEAYWVLGSPLSTSNFTPPTSPWTITGGGGSGAIVYEFDGDPTLPLSYTWRSKLNLLPHPATFNYCQVEAEDYDDLTLRVYGNGVQLFETAVTSDEPFTLPMTDRYERFFVEFVGSSRVQTAQFVEDVMELE